jgi:glycerophosphoryl diester phosphodiesterase
MVRIIAHRGSSRLLPENSLAAFRHATESGADALEVDLRRSADGRIYCFHDPNLSRLTGYSGYLRRTDSKAVDRLRLPASEPVLRFEEFLEEFAGRIEFVFDVKSAGIEAEILRLVAQQPRKSPMIFSSFNSKILIRIKSLAPKSKTALIVGPMRNLKLKFDLSAYMVNTLTQLNCHAVHLSRHIAKEGLVRRLLGAGLVVAVWTVDDYEIGAKLIGMGVGGLITNVPEEMTPLWK